MDIDATDERLLVPKEVAFFLKVHPETVYKWLKAGKIKAVKIGTQWRVRVKDLKEFMGV